MNLMWKIGRLVTFAAVSALALVALVLAVALLNLNRIIASRQSYLTNLATQALGRPVSVGKITGSLGLGFSIKVSELSIADDPAFARTPFFHATTAHAKIRLLQLLFGRVEISDLSFDHATIRLIRNAQGVLNVSTIGADQSTNRPQSSFLRLRTGFVKVGQMSEVPTTAPLSPTAFMVSSVSFKDSELYYSDGMLGLDLSLTHLNIRLSPVSLALPSEVELSGAILGEERNLHVRGQVGPLMRDGRVDITSLPFTIAARLAPLEAEKLVALMPVAWAFARQFVLTGPATVEVHASGMPEAISFRTRADLSAVKLSYPGLFEKATAIKSYLEVEGNRGSNGTVISKGTLAVAGLSAGVTDFRFAPAAVSGNVQIDRLQLGQLAKLSAPVARYKPSGWVEAKGQVEASDGRAKINGLVKLSEAGFVLPDSPLNRFTNVEAQLAFYGDKATLRSLAFSLGNARFIGQATSESLNLSQATFKLASQHVTLADLIPRKAAYEQYALDGLSVEGILRRDGVSARSSLDAQLRANSCFFAKIPCEQLSASVRWIPEVARVDAFQVGVGDGELHGNGSITLSGTSPFNLFLRADNLDIGQIASQLQGRNSAVKQGRLNGEIKLTGRYSSAPALVQSLDGTGRLLVNNAVIVGANPTTKVFAKLSRLPGLGDLITPVLVDRHPVALSPDMRLQTASATFVIKGPVAYSQDIKVVAQDYTLSGEGWLNLDQQLDFRGVIALSPQLSRDLVAKGTLLGALKGADDLVRVPLRASGTLSDPKVQPDLARSLKELKPEAIKSFGQKLLEKLF